MVARLAALLAVLSLVLAAGCGSDADSDNGGSVSEAVAEQLRYLDPQSSSVVAVDLRWEGENLDDVKSLASRLLKAYREELPLPERKSVPETAEDGLEMLVGFANLSFADDVRPALDGHLVVATNPAPQEGRASLVAVYRTEKGDLRRVYERIVGERLEPLAGYPDAVGGAGVAIVGTKTLVVATGDEDDSEPNLRAALDRAKDGGGFPAERLAEAERDTGMTGPLVLMTGDLRAARQVLVEEQDLERAREAVPYLRALTRVGAALDVTSAAIEAKARVVTDGEKLAERDLPVAPAGEVELPEADGAVVGGSRNQSHTTTFLSRIARALFADSRFVKAVEAAEKELGASFEDEVLRQFDCPSVSVSVLEPPRGDAPDAAPRFGARSCVADPDRMRELLPRLRPHLPAILAGLQGLGDEGLTALLLLAPDAPLVPGGPIAQIRVTPADEGAAGETLYEIDGLRDDADDPVAQAGPDAITFGLIGDAFVVASDTEMARRAAKLETEKLDREAGSALRAPLSDLLARNAGDQEARAAAKVLGDLVGTLAAEPAATVAEARIAIRD